MTSCYHFSDRIVLGGPLRWLRLVIAASLLFGKFNLIAGAATADARGEPATNERLPVLMPDDFSEMNLLAWRVEPGAPDPNNPLIEGDMPWDSGGVGIHGCVLKDPINGLWKAYLVSTPADPAFLEKQPWASENSAFRRICLFESSDGVHWTRPKLSNVLYDGKPTNIIFDLTQGVSAYGSVNVNPGNRQWPYDMIVLREAWLPKLPGGSPHGSPPQGNGYYRYRSKDGRAWEPLGKVRGPMTGDLAFFYRNGDSDYVCYYRLPAQRQPNDHLPAYEDAPRRSLYRATSRDGNTWEKDPAMVLTADERDHRDTQYQECVPIKLRGGYFALITMYHPITQTLNLRMAASRDGRQWWFPDRVPCLDNAPLGDYGGGMIWQSKNLIVQDGRLYVYYGGTEGPHRQISDTRAPSVKIGPTETVIDHGAHFLPFNSALCRASWRFDRLYALVSAAGGPTVGTAVTKPRELAGASLWLNLRTRPAKKSSTAGLDEGYLQVELLDADGKPLPGFTRNDCPPIRGDHQAVQVTWAGGAKAPAGANSAKFYLKRVFLYGFEFRDRKDAEETAASAEAKAAALTTAKRLELRPYRWEGAYAQMRAKHACPHDDGLCAELRAPWMKERERLILRAAEIVGYESGYLYDDHFPTQEQQGRGKGYRHIPFRWETTQAPTQLSALCQVPGKGQFKLVLTAGADRVDIVLSIRNDLAKPMKYVDWYFCPVAYEAPTIFNPALDRTFLYDGHRLRRLADIVVRETPNETMFLVAGDRGAGGFVPPLHAANPRGSIQAKLPLVVVENEGGTKSVGLAFQRAHSIFSSAGNGCLHADPYFGQNLKPGEERRVHGRLYVIEGSAADVLKRFRTDFPSPVRAHGAILDRLKQGERLTICAIGTSLTGDYYDPAKQVGVPSAWFPLLGKWLNTLYPGQVSTHNEAIGGAASKYTATYTTPGSGLDVQLARALAHDPDVLFLEFAANDAYLKYGISRQASKNNLQEMIDRARAWAAKHNQEVEIIVQTMNNFTHAGERPEEAVYYQGYRDVAAANQVLLIDHYSNWLELFNKEKYHATWNRYVPDGAHPNELGAERVILPEIQRVLKRQSQ